MTHLPSHGPVLQVQAQPDIYTLLILVAVLAMLATLGVVLYYMFSAPPAGCGLTFGDLFGSIKELGLK